MAVKNGNKKNKANERFTNLVNSLEKKIDQLNREEKNGKKHVRPNVIEVVCSQDDIERTAKRKK